MKLKSTAEQKNQSTDNNHEKYQDVFGFLDSVAEEKKIEIEDTPNSMKEKIVNLCNLLQGPLYEEILGYVQNLNIRQLFEQISQREYIQKEFDAL